MAYKKEIKTEGLEREYVIPLRDKLKKVPKYKRANKAIKSIREFLVRHLKIRNRDLKKIKINKYLNEIIWTRGIKKPPIKIRVSAVKEKDIVNVKPIEIPDKLKFKKLREEKKEQKAMEAISKKKDIKKEEVKTEKTDKEKKEDIKKEQEKKLAVVEAERKRAKEDAKKAKRQTGKKAKQPKRQIRKALDK